MKDSKGLIGGVIGTFTDYGLSYGMAYILPALIQPQQNTAFRNPTQIPSQLPHYSQLNGQLLPSCLQSLSA
jgi:hypothetical protein